MMVRQRGMKLTLLSSWIYESMELYLCTPTCRTCQIFRCKYTLCVGAIQDHSLLFIILQIAFTGLLIEWCF